MDEADMTVENKRQRIGALDAELAHAKKEIDDLENAKRILSEDLLKKRAEAEKSASQNKKLGERLRLQSERAL